MNFKDFYKREKHVTLKAQPKNFRIGKWVIIVLVMAGLSMWKGWSLALGVFCASAALGIILHFLMRWKTEGWTKSWGPYKRIPLDGE